ncbi:37S ribosomal protein S25, mitochondrial [Komagataella phaffii CBS 7435]|uniref:37S ribosomal protein S25, mitochondrial n=2 Tax=Komagataella phaffii TaxID=460519 RepID=C4R2M9_KOMPG|nr:mitochondrial 37S ribosomal protein RSM25 [Komagataella phaffii GS115]AOA62112.1 GQ67_01173T0 [Komagataella phaffii]CAH2447692.1 37S ribosomal protein S25, mitochondrial [Komagataella phaffii CBS 7435]AOA67270.1 GQ68_00216T0 [Komagataella phaffii GS115]CAY69753.1 Mitochondrial ribosomal protein of the small subunit [Komagataella phaffii GS115]CCA37874.1 37S ribosomal protein S25, mitochondrial [Komagataella phaffii CBS 7435]
MKIQQNAINILERTSNFLKSGVIKQQPAWYKVVGSIPPQVDLTRKAAVNQQNTTNFVSQPSTFKTRVNPRTIKNKLYRSQKLEFVEDELRALFYDQHPWERANPKLVVENANDIELFKLDWSNIRQLTKPFDGENVVQRTLYLVQNENLSILEAYDKARFEYYQVKMQLEAEDSISKEEATMYGAQFKESALEYGFQKEQEVIDQWKEEAEQQTELLQNKAAGVNNLEKDST